MTLPQAVQLALQHHQAGRLAGAEALYRQILAVQPNHADALHMLGVIAHQVGRQESAIELIGKALALNPGDAVAWSNLGEAYRALGRLEEAITAYRRALQLQPNDPVAQYNLGNALSDGGQLTGAIAAYRRVLELKPDYVDAHNNLGIALARQGSYAEAGAAYHRLLQLTPTHADSWNNLGIVLAQQGRFGEAVEAYRRALQLQPDQPEAHNNLGNAYQALGRLELAIAAYHQALKLDPRSAKLRLNLGNALRQMGQLEEAIVKYRGALALQPNLAEAHNELGNALRDLGRLDEAAAAYRAALELNPQYAGAENNFGNLLHCQGQIDGAVQAYRRALAHESGQSAQSNLIYTLHFHPECAEETILREQRLWNERFGSVEKLFARPIHNTPLPDRRLRVGYVSPDFREHVIGRNLWPLFQQHDRAAFEIFCYSGVIRPDGMTEQFRQRADGWRKTPGVNDDALAEMIQHDEVDILVDLTQHMAGNRLTMFARRPAPVQVSFAGYPAGTGVAAIPYRISDRWLEPEPAENGLMPIDSFWCYDPCGAEIETNELPAQQSGAIAFGCLNNFCKVNEPTLRLWAKVLTRVPDSRLLLLSPEGSQRQWTWQILQSEGVAPRRVEFVRPCGRLAYLELYHRLDVMLDTFPYNGHTTSLDALWMGVPVVSLAGKTSVSRAGWSQLSNLGLADLVATSRNEFVEIAGRLARDLPRLSELRRTLRTRMEASVLMDAPRFARQIEAVYRTLWRRWCAEVIHTS